MGRFGNLMLVNGEPGWELDVLSGEVVRFFLTNVSNTRTFNVTFAKARVKLVASDLGRFEREQWVSSVVIAPAELETAAGRLAELRRSSGNGFRTSRSRAPHTYPTPTSPTLAKNYISTKGFRSSAGWPR